MNEFKEIIESDDVVADLLRRQMWRYRDLDQPSAKRRMLGYLARRGYDRDLANRAVQRICLEMLEK